MLRSGEKPNENPHIAAPCARLPSQACFTGPRSKYIAYNAAGTNNKCCKLYKCSQSNAPFLNMYSVKPQTWLPVTNLDKKSTLQTSSGIAPRHNCANAQKGFLNNKAKPRMMKVWLLNQTIYSGRLNVRNVKKGVTPIIKKIQPNNTLFCIYRLMTIKIFKLVPFCTQYEMAYPWSAILNSMQHCFRTNHDSHSTNCIFCLRSNQKHRRILQPRMRMPWTKQMPERHLLACPPIWGPTMR